MPATEVVKKSLSMQVDGPLRERGKPKRTWMDRVKLDLMTMMIQYYGVNNSYWTETYGDLIL